jgi:3',5'-cyclic AMP phosphodiesterase CpdA
MRLIIVTDSHLAGSAPACNANWDVVRQYAAQSASDLTVHLGDITMDAVSDRSQLSDAQTMFESWPTSLRFLPGNHDVGDNPPGPENPARQPLEPNLIERFRARFGPDYWNMAMDGWLAIGLNAQLLGSNTREETEQWRWLGECVRQAGTRPVALMLHKPLFQTSWEDQAAHTRYVPVAPRRRLWNMIAKLDLRIVLSGHVHQYLDRPIDGVRHIWIPSTAFVLPDTIQESVGVKITGLGLLELRNEGYRFELIRPRGLSRTIMH